MCSSQNLFPIWGRVQAKIYSQSRDMSKPKFIHKLGKCPSQNLFSTRGRVQAKIYSQVADVSKPKFILKLGKWPSQNLFLSRGCVQAEIYSQVEEMSKVSKGAKIRNRYNQVPHLTQHTNRTVTNSQLDPTNESQEISPFPAGDHKAHINRRAQRHSKHDRTKT